LVQGVWDPPLVLDGTDYIPRPTITAEPENLIHITTPAIPGKALPNVHGPATDVPWLDDFHQTSHSGMPIRPHYISKITDPTKTNQLHDSLAPGLEGLAGLAPTAVVTLGNTMITVAALADPEYVLFGSRVLRVGDPSIIIAGEAISFGADGRLEAGRAGVVYLPRPTKVLGKDGVFSSSWQTPRTPSSVGTAIAIGVIGSSAANGTAEGVVPKGSKTKLSTSIISDDGYSEDTAIPTSSIKPSVSSKEKKKKSEAGRYANIFPGVIPFMCFGLGVWLRSGLF